MVSRPTAGLADDKRTRESTRARRILWGVCAIVDLKPQDMAIKSYMQHSLGGKRENFA
jgi:hypothetical protein